MSLTRSRELELNVNLSDVTIKFGGYHKVASLPWYRCGPRRLGEKIDTRGTKTDARGRSRDVEATRACFDIIRLAAARVVIIVILSRLLGRFRAIVVLSGRLDRLARFVVILAVVVVSQGGLRDSVVCVHIFFRCRAVSGGCVTVACEIAGVIFGSGLGIVLTSGRSWSILVVVVVVIMVINGRRGCGRLICS